MQLTDHFLSHNIGHDQTLADAIAMADTHKLTSVFHKWEKAPPHFRNAVQTVITTLQDRRSANFSAQDVSLINAAATLAAVDNKNPYHGNTHFLKVFTMSAFLGGHAHANGRADAHNLALLLTSALIHDLDHDGTNNKGEKYRLENIALCAAEAPLRQAGATDQDWQLIKAFVHTTDVSKDFANPDAVSPSESVKLFALTGNPKNLFPELRILADTNTADIALTLEDADLGNSILDPALCTAGGMALAAEQNRDYDPNGQKFFLEHICHGRLFSMSGHQLLQPHMDNVMTHYGLAPTPPDNHAAFGLK